MKTNCVSTCSLLQHILKRQKYAIMLNGVRLQSQWMNRDIVWSLWFAAGLQSEERSQGHSCTHMHVAYSAPRWRYHPAESNKNDKVENNSKGKHRFNVFYD